jgi:hypothetical protein
MRRAPKERDWGAEFRALSERGRAKAKPRSEQTASFGGPTNPSWVDVQAKLNSLGANPQLKVDGSPGQGTRAAVVAFQRAHGLEPDGNPGPATLGAMGFVGATSVAGATPGRGTFVPIKPTGPSPIPGLRAAVVANLPPLFGQWEGRGLPFMYTDKKGYVTTGTGNKIDPISQALVLPWKHPDGTAASQSEIADAWNTVKRAWPGVQSNASQGLTSIRLSQKDLDDFVLRTVANNHAVLSKIYPGYQSWPSDAQMAAHSLAWAWGPGFASVWDTLGIGPLGTQFKNAVSKSPPDFIAAAAAAKPAGDHDVTVKGNTGLAPRNAAQGEMFANAASVVAKKGDYDSFFYPFEVTAAKVAMGVGGLLLLGGAGFGLWYLLASGSPRQVARLQSSSSSQAVAA